MSNTSEHWRRWAEQDPYHGVFGRNFRVGEIEQPDIREEIFRHGNEHIDMVLALYRGQVSSNFSGWSVNRGGQRCMMPVAVKQACAS